MAYVTPITDRAESDIIARNSKAFFNVADWTRIVGNTAYMMTYLNFAFGLSLVPAGLSSPSTATVPTNDYMNTMINDIVLCYVAAGFSAANAPRHDWPGNGPAAPNWVDVNQWESALESARLAVHSISDSAPICGYDICGGTLAQQSTLAVYA